MSKREKIEQGLKDMLESQSGQQAYKDGRRAAIKGGILGDYLRKRPPVLTPFLNGFVDGLFEKVQ